MVASKSTNIKPLLTLNAKQIELVQKHKHFGLVINDQKDPGKEIKIRIETARKTFVKYSAMLSNRNLNLHVKIRFMEWYVWSVFLYRVET